MYVCMYVYIYDTSTLCMCVYTTVIYIMCVVSKLMFTFMMYARMC